MSSDKAIIITITAVAALIGVVVGHDQVPGITGIVVGAAGGSLVGFCAAFRTVY